MLTPLASLPGPLTLLGYPDEPLLLFQNIVFQYLLGGIKGFVFFQNVVDCPVYFWVGHEVIVVVIIVREVGNWVILVDLDFGGRGKSPPIF